MHYKPTSLDVIDITIIKGVNMNIAKLYVATTHSNIDTPLSSSVLYSVGGDSTHPQKQGNTLARGIPLWGGGS